MESLAPLIKNITLDQLNRDPYPIYKYLRCNVPGARIKSVGVPSLPELRIQNI